MSKSRLILCHTQIQLQKHVKRLFCPSGRRIHYFSAYPKQNEMAYRFSCPYTHYHNGKINKNHKHLIETSLTLTAQANMRLEYWWEVSLTPTQLINMISTSVLDNISPLEKITQNKLDYSFLRCFMCVCYPNLRVYNKHKFDFHSSKCTSIAYGPQHKGFLYACTSQVRCTMKQMPPVCAQ